MLLEISEGRWVKLLLETSPPGDLLLHTLRGITRKSALLLGQCGPLKHIALPTSSSLLIALNSVWSYDPALCLSAVSSASSACLSPASLLSHPVRHSHFFILFITRLKQFLYHCAFFCLIPSLYTVRELRLDGPKTYPKRIFLSILATDSHWHPRTL